MPEITTAGLLQATRPRMPTVFDDQRAIHQFTRMQILIEQWDDVIGEWLEDQIGAERAQVWGIPDTSANPLADLSRQLSTPGLYGKRPQAGHTTKPFASELVGERGILAGAGFWTKQVFVQYLTLGLGDMFLAWGMSNDGRLTERLVWPHNVYLRSSPDDESQASELWELRIRPLPTSGELIFTWDVYNTGALDAAGNRIREPSFSVHRAKAGSAGSGSPGGLGEDISRMFVQRPDGGFGARIGDDYPWVSEDGQPVIPYSHYQDSDTGQLWNWWTKRGTHRGTLNTALYWTFAGHCAKDATGSYVIVAGLHPGAHEVILGPGHARGGTADRNPVSGIVPVKTKLVTPGAIEYHEVQDNATPFVHEVGPGANLDSVANFADRYEMKLAVRWGLNPSDLSRTAANPSSAAALMVSNEGKRDFSEQVEPVFRRHDLESFRLAAIVLRAAGKKEFPETGYSITYVRIPKSPGELKSEREDLQWEEERGQRSSIDTYRKRHPGTTREDALAAIAQVAVDEAESAKAIQEALAAAGLGDEDAAPTSRIELTGTDLASIVTVNEARTQDGLGPLQDENGNPDPDGALTVAEFNAKRRAIAEAEAAALAAAAEPVPAPNQPDGGSPPDGDADTGDEGDDGDDDGNTTTTDEE